MVYPVGQMDIAHRRIVRDLHPRYVPGNATVTTLYRVSAARNVIDGCRRLGVVLLANGTGVHAYPHGRLQRHPGMIAMVKRYRDEVMQLLDGVVE